MRNTTAMAAAAEGASTRGNIAFWWLWMVMDNGVVAAAWVWWWCEGWVYFCYYLGFSITTCLSPPAGIRDLTSWLPRVVVPSLLMYKASPAGVPDSSR